MATNPWAHELSALQQIDLDIIAWSGAIVANLQAWAALSTAGVMRTTVDFIDVTLSSRATEATLLLATRNPIATLVNSHPAVTGASSTPVAANAARRSLIIKNPATSASPIFLHFGAAPAVVTDYPLDPGESWTTIEPNVFTGEIRAITGGAALSLSVVEG